MYFNNPCALLFQFSIRLLKEIYSGDQLEVYSFYSLIILYLTTRHLSQRISLNKYYIINITIYKLSTFGINIYLK